MKRTYVKSRKSRRSKGKQNPNQNPRDLTRPSHEKTQPTYALLRSWSDLSGSSILLEVARLPRREQEELVHVAGRVLSDNRLKRDAAWRSGAVRLIVASLPKTFALLERLLFDFSSRLWQEVHFTAFSALDRDDLNSVDQTRVISLIEKYLMSTRSQAGYASWKAGDLLGDEWKSPETIRLLEKLIFSARHVAGRRAALHGIAHVIEKGAPSENERILSLLQKIAGEDPSAEIRLYAQMTVETRGCLRRGQKGTKTSER